MKKSDRLKMRSLQPGFLVIELPNREVSRNEFRLPPGEWERLQARGFYGGIVLNHGIELKSLSEEDLKRGGLQRIPEGA